MIPELDLKSEEKLLQQTAREFAAKVIDPRAPEFFETEEFPYDIIGQMADLGLMGLLVSPEYGGGGVSTVGYVAALEEISRADMTIALTWQVHILVSSMYEKFGTPTQKDEWMPRLVRGEILAAVAMTEPGAGSDLAAAATWAKRDGDDWVLNGSKIFITNSGTKISDGMVVLARTGTRGDGKPSLSTFIVPRGTPGLVVGRKLKKLGWRAMDTHEVFFDNCRVPADNLLGPEGRGLRHVLTGMDLGRIAFGACSTGMAQACLEEALAYAKQRVQFGQPIAKFQAIQFKLADMATKIAAARALTYDAARLRDAGISAENAAAMAKLFASRVCVEAADEAFEIFGGYGFMLEYPIARRYADAKIMEIGEGTSEMLRMFIGRSLGC